MKNSAIITAFLAMFIFAALSSNGQTWKPNPKFMTDTVKKSKSASVQCFGTTKKNERCKLHGHPDASGKYFCRFHENQK